LRKPFSCGDRAAEIPGVGASRSDIILGSGLSGMVAAYIRAKAQEDTALHTNLGRPGRPSRPEAADGAYGEHEPRAQGQQCPLLRPQFQVNSSPR
jgi:hypothetical protein